MNPIEDLKTRLESMIPNSEFKLDKPDVPTNRWFLDVTRDGWEAAIEWHIEFRFGISVKMVGAWVPYGDQPHEWVIGVEPAALRIVTLLINKEPTDGG